MARTRLEVELPNIMQVIVDKAKEGQIQFVKLVLELTNKHSEKITVKQETPEVGIENYSGGDPESGSMGEGTLWKLIRF